jgi:hypothetical protein
MDKEEDLIYSLEITNGYVFRQIFELFVKLVIQRIPMFLKEDGITIRAGTGIKNGRRLISDIEIIADDIIEYYFNHDLANVKGTEETSAFTIEQFNIGDIGNTFKSVAKSNSIRIYKEKDSKEICIETKGLTSDISRIESAKIQSIEYNLSNFDDLSETPNIKIEINQFCSIMKGMTRGDPDYISFKVFKSGLAVESWVSPTRRIKDTRWGDITKKSYDNKDFFETKVNTSVVKALCKINSMATYSIIKVFSCKNGFLKLSHKIADFGEHNIYLTEEVEEKED